MKQILGSAWCFYFRWPVYSVSVFRPAGILLGGQLQLVVYWFFVFFLDFLFGPSLGISAAFLGFVVLATITGLLHEDGLADSLDSLGVLDDGSTFAKEKIEAALKDSRLGSYGVSGLLVLWLLRWGLYRGDGAIWAAGAAILFSRSVSVGWAVALSRWAKSSEVAKMSGLIGGISAKLALLNGVFALAVAGVAVGWAGFEAPAIAGASILSAAVSLLLQLGLMRRLGRISGDFIGAAICVSELTFVVGLMGISAKAL
jgi:adenosylcobinamide-GDP ribazoletransferase